MKVVGRERKEVDDGPHEEVGDDRFYDPLPKGTVDTAFRVLHWIM